MKMFQVGGTVRDYFLGLKCKDYDFAIEAPSFQHMRDGLLAQGFKIWEERPQFFTIRAHIPKTHWASTFAKDADFVLCRKEGTYTDGRRPDSVQVGTIYDDLARRDFTMNAIAIDPDGHYIDPHNGLQDINDMVIRFVGEPMDRIREDGLRVIRALRFQITKRMHLAESVRDAISTIDAAYALQKVSRERINDEMNKMFAVDSLWTVRTMAEYPMLEAWVFRVPSRLMMTMKEVK